MTAARLARPVPGRSEVFCNLRHIWQASLVAAGPCPLSMETTSPPSRAFSMRISHPPSGSSSTPYLKDPIWVTLGHQCFILLRKPRRSGRSKIRQWFHHYTYRLLGSSFVFPAPRLLETPVRIVLSSLPSIHYSSSTSFHILLDPGQSELRRRRVPLSHSRRL